MFFPKTTYIFAAESLLFLRVSLCCHKLVSLLLVLYLQSCVHQINAKFEQLEFLKLKAGLNLTMLPVEGLIMTGVLLLSQFFAQLCSSSVLVELLAAVNIDSNMQMDAGFHCRNFVNCILATDRLIMRYNLINAYSFL